MFNITDNQRAIELIWQKIELNYYFDWFFCWREDATMIFNSLRRWAIEGCILNTKRKVIWEWRISQTNLINN